MKDSLKLVITKNKPKSDEKTNRLAQEFPDFNWLEHKIRCNNDSDNTIPSPNDKPDKLPRNDAQPLKFLTPPGFSVSRPNTPNVNSNLGFICIGKIINDSKSTSNAQSDCVNQNVQSKKDFILRRHS